jgi:hypothetical protein
MAQIPNFEPFGDTLCGTNQHKSYASNDKINGSLQLVHTAERFEKHAKRCAKVQEGLKIDNKQHKV